MLSKKCLPFILLSIVILLLSSCLSRPKGIYVHDATLEAPDYSNEYYWAALPHKIDNADRTPTTLVDNQAKANADVFYLHPTSYYGKRSYNKWNAPINDDKINKGVDETPVLYQATAFNEIGKVYAPRYRQAHIHIYSTKDTASAYAALNLAYHDVRSAFEYYLANYNNGRPIIIASHSQGTSHAIRLMKEFFDNKKLSSQLVVGYLVGIRVDMAQYQMLKPCTSETDTGCLVGWRTYKKGANPSFLKEEEDMDILIHNPINWKQDPTVASKEEHKGAVLLDFESPPKPNLVSTQIHKSILWSTKPKFKGSWLMTTKNYHRGDINLFYLDIRKNAKVRLESYLELKSN